MEDIEVVDLTQDEVLIECCIPGPPVPLPRVRFFQKHVVNPATKHLARFKREVKARLPLSVSAGEVVFNHTTPVVVSIWHFLPRPLSDFTNNKRAPNRLKATAMENTYVPIKPDIDNLSKFVLDALSGLVYYDDSQVVKLVSYKMRDNEGLCGGRTYIRVEKFIG